MTRQVMVDAEVLERLIQYVDLWLEVDVTLTPQSIEEVDSDLSLARFALTLAQAQADQQVRLRALVGTWRGHIAWLEDEGDTGERHQAFTECADELEAVLGGKE